jgi:hypothetical protein
MAFNREEANQLLTACHRRCCICHRFCGVKMELDHIIPTEENGSDDITNAIPVCFECHAEIHLYNNKHPRGRKYHPSELQQHKEQWLNICRAYPHTLMDSRGAQDVGPLQALVDELEFNSEIVRRTEPEEVGALFLVCQLQRAIEEGLLSLLGDDVRNPLKRVYATMMRANMSLQKIAAIPWGGAGSAWHHAFSEAQRSIGIAKTEIETAREALLRELGHDAGTG